MKEGFLHWKFREGKYDFRIFPFQMESSGRKYFSFYIGYLSTVQWHILCIGLVRFSIKKLPAGDPGAEDK